MGVYWTTTAQITSNQQSKRYVHLGRNRPDEKRPLYENHRSRAYARGRETSHSHWNPARRSWQDDRCVSGRSRLSASFSAAIPMTWVSRNVTTATTRGLVIARDSCAAQRERPGSGARVGHLGKWVRERRVYICPVFYTDLMSRKVPDCDDVVPKSRSRSPRSWIDRSHRFARAKHRTCQGGKPPEVARLLLWNSLYSRESCGYLSVSA